MCVSGDGQRLQRFIISGEVLRARRWPLTGKVSASSEIELSDIHLLEYLDVPCESGKWNVKMNVKLSCLKALQGDVLTPHASPTLKVLAILEVEARKTLRKVLDIP